MPDIESGYKYGDTNNNSIFRMKCQLPNIQVLKSPAKMYKPIQVVSFIKNEL